MRLPLIIYGNLMSFISSHLDGNLFCHIEILIPTTNHRSAQKMQETVFPFLGRTCWGSLMENSATFRPLSSVLHHAVRVRGCGISRNSTTRRLLLICLRYIAPPVRDTRRIVAESSDTRGTRELNLRSI